MNGGETLLRRRHIFAFAFVACAAARAGESITISETRAIPPAELAAAAGATHDFTLHAYTFRGTRWKADEIATAVASSAKLLAQCGIGVASAHVNVIEAPRRFHDFHTPVSRELLRVLSTPKPAVFFVQDTRNNPAFDAEAIGLANAGTRPELANTVWIAWGARDLPYALVHELVHVLSNSGEHSTQPGNLMRSETTPENHRLTEAQCGLIRTRGEANGLLKRRGA
jgi:hypothetical protein